MKRMTTLILTFALLIAALVVPAQAAELPELPDPGVLLNVDGEFYDSETIDDVQVIYYTYYFDMTSDEINYFLYDYEEEVAANGFTCEETDIEQCAYSAMYQYENEMPAEMALIFDEEFEAYDSGESCQWIILLAVPETVAFELGASAEDPTNEDDDDGHGDHDAHDADMTPCKGCGETGDCIVCGGDGRVSYGKVSANCIACLGTGACTFCQGEGEY